MRRIAGHTRGRAPTEQRDGDGLSIAARMRHDMLRSLTGNRFYRHTLVGRVPPGVEVKIGQAWPGDPQRGAAIAAGEVELAGKLVRSPSPRWFPPAAGEDWLAR